MSKTDSPYRTLSDFRAKNKAEGMHFFDRDTMKFWNSRVESTLIRGRFFITSEDTFGDQPRRIYAVRMANNDGSVTTLKSYLDSKDSARKAISGYLLNPPKKQCKSCKREMSDTEPMSYGVCIPCEQAML